MVRTRNTKRLKGIHEEEMEDVEMEEGNDDDTVTCSNGDNRTCSFPYVPFLKMSIKVAKANKATVAMRTKFKEVFKC